MSRVKAKPRFEVYDLSASPFSQRPTQRDVAKLLGETKDDLQRIINYKEQFVKRRTQVIGGKTRHLAYPESRYRTLHERLKFHLNKIRQPNYLFSPRRGRCQRDNASMHLDQNQFLTLDLRQFYPSTTESMVYAWFVDELGMYSDVARLLTKICTIDGKVSFGSPLTPVLCSLVHRSMFDQISDICVSQNLRHTLWVDNLTISGQFVPGKVVNEVREVIKSFGLRSHEIRYRFGNRPVFITGIGVVGSNLVAPNFLHLKIRDIWDDLRAAETVDERDYCIQILLSKLGTIRHIVGRSSEAGRKASNQMNMLRQKRDKIWLSLEETRSQERPSVSSFPTGSLEEVPF